MATKAQLEAELADLKAKLAANSSHPSKGESDVDDAPAEARTTLEDMLADQGIDTKEIEELWAQFSAELGDFPQQKPLLTAIAAFGLGFVLGRMSKS